MSTSTEWMSWKYNQCDSLTEAALTVTATIKTTQFQCTDAHTVSLIKASQTGLWWVLSIWIFSPENFHIDKSHQIALSVPSGNCHHYCSYDLRYLQRLQKQIKNWKKCATSRNHHDSCLTCIAHIKEHYHEHINTVPMVLDLSCCSTAS